MMRKLFWLLCFSFLILSGCAKSPWALKHEFRVDNNKVFKESFALRGKTIPLPPGEWRIMASGFDAERFFKVALFQEYPGKLISYINITVDSVELAREGGYTIWSELNRKDMHHVVSVKNAQSEKQDGWIVNNIVAPFTSKGKNQLVEDAAAYIKANNLVISNDYIAVTHRLTGKHPFKKRYLYVSYYYNPEASGFSPSSKSEWASSDWNALRINTDLRKVDYINELIKQHADMHEKIKAGFHP